MATYRKSKHRNQNSTGITLSRPIISFNVSDKAEKRKFKNQKKGGEANNCLILKASRINHAEEIHPIDRRLAELGQKRGWLASKTGISEGHIGAICRREARLIPGSVVQGKLCWILNLDLNQILGLKTTGQK